MPRPFRYQPPSPADRMVLRPRLMALLAQRWSRRVITLTAGPGFGKTSLLVAATTGQLPPAGTDVWLSCEPADESADHLTGGLAEAFGLPSDAGVDAVLGAVWAIAPADVCIVLDDVHEIPSGSPGAAVLGRLVTDLAANGHLVLASRDAIPVPLARLAASGQLARVTEDDLVFNADELAEFASAHRIDPAVLASTGGWPALAELTASAGADLVLDYLWEEVLAGLGRDRADLLARFDVVGGGDDAVASAVAGRAVTVDELVTAVPLVQRSIGGWAALHPLWEPALRPLLTPAEATAARCTVADVHRRHGRFGLAVDLLVEAEAWDGVLEVIRDAESHIGVVRPGDFGRWHRLLPSGWRGRPEALLASGLALRSRMPTDATSMLARAAEGFRAVGDVDGELAALSHDGLLRWVANDIAGLLNVYVRVEELAASGSTRARQVQAIGVAGMAHLAGDSSAVLEALASETDSIWLETVCWLRSVAHRRDGDLPRARAELDRAAAIAVGAPDPQREIARLRIAWLEGEVDEVAASLHHHHTAYVEADERYLARESGLELAGKAAWLGDAHTARVLLEATADLAPDVVTPLTRVLEAIARAAADVADGDEARAAAILRDEVLAGPAALGSPQSWYWRDRAAIALVHVLVPETRRAWLSEPLGVAHRPGLVLAEALEAARAGDVERVVALQWPPAGVVRAHLPLRWVVELAAVGTTADLAPSHDLLRTVGERAWPALRAIASTDRADVVATAASRLTRALPALPSYRLRVGVLGPLRVWRDDVAVECAELRRRRVRELLCYLVAGRRVRREALSEDLWPDVADPGHNASVTLSYLQRVLQPDRAQGEHPYFLRTEGAWLELAGGPNLETDAWMLDDLLDDAGAADRAGDLSAALDSYRAALPLWRGEPFGDAPYALWAEPERTRLRTRYVTAAVRAGELWLAARAVGDARRAGEAAIAADPASEPAFRLLARAHIANDDLSSARATLERCRKVLAHLGVESDLTTDELLASLAR